MTWINIYKINKFLVRRFCVVRVTFFFDRLFVHAAAEAKKRQTFASKIRNNQFRLECVRVQRSQSPGFGFRTVCRQAHWETIAIGWCIRVVWKIPIKFEQFDDLTVAFCWTVKWFRVQFENTQNASIPSQFEVAMVLFKSYLFEEKKIDWNFGV